MLDYRKTSEYWKEIIQIYKEDMNEGHIPAYMAARIVEKIGAGNAKEVFATVAQAKKHDGRIYSENRKWSDEYPINGEVLPDELYSKIDGLDDIHTTHINRLITEIRKF